jgi:hypothetical protein
MPLEGTFRAGRPSQPGVKKLALPLVAIVAVLATGCLGSSSAHAPKSSASTTQSSTTPRVVVAQTSGGAVAISGGTPREQALLRQVVDQSGVSAVVAAQLGGPSGGFSQPGVWLRLTLAVTNPNKAIAIAPVWQGELVEGAYRALSVRDGLPALAGVIYDRRLPSGKTLGWNAGVAGGNAPSRSTSRATATRMTITTDLATAAKAAGWQLRDVTLFRPDGFAAQVTLVAAHPRGFATQLSAFERHARIPGVAGTLIDVQNPCGATVYQESNARWVGIYANHADPTWLCPNPAASLPTPCPAVATTPC